MRVQEIYSQNPRSCRRDTDLATAAWMMWHADCGVVSLSDAILAARTIKAPKPGDLTPRT